MCGKWPMELKQQLAEEIANIVVDAWHPHDELRRLSPRWEKDPPAPPIEGVPFPRHRA